MLKTTERKMVNGTGDTRSPVPGPFSTSSEVMMIRCKMHLFDTSRLRLINNPDRNSTRSLYDSDVVYFEIHGRRYCKDYYMPNDEDEQTRLQMINGITFSILGDRLLTAPVRDPKKILDVGTGTGEWAIAMGDEYPEAEVIGTDIAKIQPTAVPLNVFFEIDDAEEEDGWTWAEDEFDLVHLRYMSGAFTDWKHIYGEAYTHLKPGGWVEILDFDDHNDLLGFFPPESDVHTWFTAVNEGSEKSGRSQSTSHLKPENLQQLGFVDVSCTTFSIPMGAWRDDTEGQKTGKHFLFAIVIGAQALSLRVLSEQMGWDHEKITRLTDSAKAQVWNMSLDPIKANGMGFRVKVLTGRKPGGPDDFGGVEDTSSSRTVTMTDSGVEGVNGFIA